MTVAECLQASTEFSILAEQHFNNGNPRVGAELLWGALSQVVIAIAIQRGQRYKEHQHRRHVMRQIIAELNDRRLWKTIRTPIGFTSIFT